MTANHQEIERLINSGAINAAIDMCKKEFSKPEGVDDDTLWFLYGKALWKAGRQSESTIAYKRAVELNPHSPAAVALEISESVSEFFNPDLLNP